MYLFEREKRSGSVEARKMENKMISYRTLRARKKSDDSPSLIVRDLPPTGVPSHIARLNVHLCFEPSNISQFSLLHPFLRLAITHFPWELFRDYPSLSSRSILPLVQFYQSFRFFEGGSDRFLWNDILSSFECFFDERRLSGDG